MLWRWGYRSRVFGHGIADRRGDFTPRGIWDANIQYRVPVSTRQLHGSVDRLQHIRLQQFALAKYPYAGAVAIEEVSMLG